MSEQKGDVYDQMIESLRRFNAMLPTAEEGARSLMERIPMYSIDNLVRIRETADGDELSHEPRRNHLIVKPMEHNS